MKTIYLVRHGETASNLEQKFQGSIDTPLNNTGLAGAQSLVERFQEVKLSAIYASPLTRAVQTATPLAKAQNLSIQQDARLQEISFGKWEGLTFAEIIKHSPEEHQMLYQAPSQLDLKGEEDFFAAQKRGWDAVQSIMAQQAEESSVALVSHGGMIRLLLCALLNVSIDAMWKFSVNNVSITKLFSHETIGVGIRYHNNLGKA